MVRRLNRKVGGGHNLNVKVVNIKGEQLPRDVAQRTGGLTSLLPRTPITTTTHTASRTRRTPLGSAKLQQCRCGSCPCRGS